MGTTEQVAELARPLLEERGLELYDVEVAGAVLRVVADGPEGVDLESLDQVSRRLSRALDQTDPLPGRYTLEVSSPGLERRLRHQRHFQAALGSTVKVKTVPSAPGDRRLSGELSGVDDTGVTVETAGGPRHLAYEEIERAQTVFEWDRSAGRSRNGAGAS